MKTVGSYYQVLLSRFILFTVFAFFYSFLLTAQENEKQSLRSILFELENRFYISFAYVDDDVNNIFIISPPDNYDLNESIEYLKDETGLVFQILNDRFITIWKPPLKLIDFCGRVMDEKNSEFIGGATIQSGVNFTISDENGYFELKNLKNTDSLLVRTLGYEYLNAPLNTFDGNSCDTLFLKQKIKKLKEIIISNFITQGIDKDAESKYIINSKSLDILPGLTEPDVLQTVQALPGIMSIDETVSDINVRGGTNDQNLILWNGIRMYQSGHFFGLISAFNPFTSREVSLTKNGSSAFLGDVVSSTLDIQTENSVKKKISGSGGVNMINADFNINLPLFEKSSLQLSARRSITDFLHTPTYKSYFERVFKNTEVSNPTDFPDSLQNSDESFLFHDFSLNYNLFVSSHDKIELSFLRIYNNINYQENAFISEDTISKTSGLEQKSIAAGMIYRRLWNEKFRTNAQIYISNYQLDAVNFGLFMDQRIIQENEVLDKSLKLDARYAFNDLLDIYGGYQLMEIGVGNLIEINNPPYNRYEKHVLLSHGIFTEVNSRSHSGNTKFRGGFRLNYISKFNKWLLEPRFVFNQRFSQYFSIEILGELKSQNITQIIDLQNEFLGVEKRRWALSNNEDIPIIQSSQISAGLNYQRSGILISVEGYIKNVKGITSRSQGFQNQYQYIISTGEYKIKGLDFLINKRFNHITSWLSYSYAKNDYYFPEFTPSTFPNNLDIRHVLSFGISYQSSNFQVSGGIHWRTGKPFTEATGIEDNKILYQPANSSRLDNYLRCDLSAIYKFNISSKVSGEVGASIWNLINRQNILNIYYKPDNQGGIDVVQQYALRITPNLMFRINF